jgi:hypothetical protein
MTNIAYMNSRRDLYWCAGCLSFTGNGLKRGSECRFPRRYGRRPSPAHAGGVKVKDVEYPALPMGCRRMGFAAVA